MKSYQITLSAVAATLAFTFLLFKVTVAQEEVTCRGETLNMTDAQKTVVTDCMKDQGVENAFKIPPEKLGCFGVCVWKRKGLLTPTGKLDHDRIFNYVENVMRPDEVKKPIKDGIDKCFKEHGDAMVVDNDPQCKAYMKTGNCVHDVFLKHCNTGNKTNAV